MIGVVLRGRSRQRTTRSLLPSQNVIVIRLPSKEYLEGQLRIYGDVAGQEHALSRVKLQAQDTISPAY